MTNSMTHFLSKSHTKSRSSYDREVAAICIGEEVQSKVQRILKRMKSSKFMYRAWSEGLF